PDDSPEVAKPEPEPLQAHAGHRCAPYAPSRRPEARGQGPRHQGPEDRSPVGRPLGARQSEILQEKPEGEPGSRGAEPSGEVIGDAQQDQEPIEQSPG